MTHLLVSLYDNKAEKYSQPTLARSKADFIRSVQIEAKNPQSMLHKFPADYDLYVLTQWSEDTALLGSTPDPQRLGSVLDLCPLS